MQFTTVSIAGTVNTFMSYEEIICDANHLYEAYKASIKGSKWKETTQKYMMNFLMYIFELQDELQNRTLTNDAPHEFVLSERGRIRTITSIPLKDRIIRHVLCDRVLLPEVRRHVIYDNGASLKGRGISFQCRRFEIHLHKFYQEYGTDGWILFGDFSKFYDNIIHDIAKQELLNLFHDDTFMDWLLTVIFKGFEVDVSYMNEDEYVHCMDTLFNKLDYRQISKSKLTGEKWMAKSVNIGDQLSQAIGIYYPKRIDTYIKYVKSQRYYGRYMDDWYIMHPSKEALKELLKDIQKIAAERGIHINMKKTRIVRISEPFTFLQVKYRLTPDGKITKRLTTAKVMAMRRKLKRLAKKVCEGSLAYEPVEEMYRSWMGSFYKLMSRQQRIGLIGLFEDLFDKQIHIEHRKMIILDRRKENKWDELRP